MKLNKEALEVPNFYGKQFEMNGRHWTRRELSRDCSCAKSSERYEKKPEQAQFSRAGPKLHVHSRAQIIRNDDFYAAPTTITGM